MSFFRLLIIGLQRFPDMQKRAVNVLIRTLGCCCLAKWTSSRVEGGSLATAFRPAGRAAPAKYTHHT